MFIDANLVFNSAQTFWQSNIPKSKKGAKHQLGVVSNINIYIMLEFEFFHAYIDRAFACPIHSRKSGHSLPRWWHHSRIDSRNKTSLHQIREAPRQRPVGTGPAGSWTLVLEIKGKRKDNDFIPLEAFVMTFIRMSFSMNFLNFFHFDLKGICNSIFFQMFYEFQPANGTHCVYRWNSIPHERIIWSSKRLLSSINWIKTWIPLRWECASGTAGISRN